MPNVRGPNHIYKKMPRSLRGKKVCHFKRFPSLLTMGTNTMRRWVLNCGNFNKDFTHSEMVADRKGPLRDPFDWIEAKPDFPTGGLSLECPNCKKTSVYQRQELTYRAS
jgi:hypothetical protein